MPAAYTGSGTKNTEVNMPEPENPESYTLTDCHKKLAVDLFNHTWELLDKPDRTPADDDRMVHAAHASRFHWGEVGKPLHFERGEWLVSRVYAVLKRPGPALHHAGRCLDICRENDIAGFDIAFAYEAMARAHALAGDEAEAGRFMKLAREAGEQIEKQEDREYFEGELKTIPGWGD